MKNIDKKRFFYFNLNHINTFLNKMLINKKIKSYKIKNKISNLKPVIFSESASENDAQNVLSS